MKSDNFLKDRVVQALLLIVAFNLVALVLLWRLDLFVHTDLYDYGLEFNYNWVKNYWYNNRMGWTLLAGSTALVALSFIPHYVYRKEHSRFSRGVGLLLCALALVYQGLSIIFLWEVNSIVQTSLYNFGLTASYSWISITTYLNSTILIIMIAGLIAFVVPFTRNLQVMNPHTKRIKTKTLDQFQK